MVHSGREPFEEPLEVSVCDHEVVLLGPDGIAGSFTPHAAIESAKRLLRAAAEAGVAPKQIVRGGG